MGHHRDNGDSRGVRCLDTYCFKNTLEDLYGDVWDVDNTLWYVSRVGECYD